MDGCGMGDHICALPSVIELAKSNEVTVLSATYYKNLWESIGCSFTEQLGQTASRNFLALFDRHDWLIQWSAREEAELGFQEHTRFGQFASLVGVTLPDEFDWRKIFCTVENSGDYIVFAGSATERWRSLPDNVERELFERLSSIAPVIRLPHVNINSHSLDPRNEKEKFVAGTFEELVQCVANAKAVVAVEGGVLHVAAANGIPSVGIYGLTGPEIILQYKRFSPSLLHAVVQGSGNGCHMPCYRHRKNGFLVCEDRQAAYCMEHVDLDLVLHSVQQFL